MAPLERRHFFIPSIFYNDQMEEYLVALVFQNQDLGWEFLQLRNQRWEQYEQFFQLELKPHFHGNNTKSHLLRRDKAFLIVNHFLRLNFFL